MPRRVLSAPEKARVLAVFREGGSLRQAADHAGVPRSTLSDLLHRGASGHHSDEARFVRQCWQARGDRAKEALTVIRKRLPNWQAAAWYLERSDPGTFALHRRPAVEVASAPDEARPGHAVVIYDPDAGPLPPASVRVFLPDNGRGGPYPDAQDKSSAAFLAECWRPEQAQDTRT